MKSTSTPMRSDFIEAARAYLGVPFRHQGRDGRGLDCLGLLVCAARDAGFPVSDNLNYRREPDYDVMHAGIMDHFVTVARNVTEPGDVLWLRWRRNAYPMHLAIILANGFVLHADGNTAKKVIEQPMPGSWAERIVFALRWRGFVDVR